MVAGVSLQEKPKKLHSGIVLHLSAVRAVDAVYARDDERSVCHIYSVVQDHDSAIYQTLAIKEQRITEEFPDVQFEFHVRAHQGRKLAEAVPPQSRLLFAR